MNPLVSIILPVHNAENYLPTCLESILNQTIKDVEVLCIDDASTDKSLDILKLYQQKDNRIKIFSLVENKGAGAARNIGLDNARGKYFYFPDADDFLENNLLEDNIECMIDNKSDINIFKVLGYDVNTQEDNAFEFAFRSSEFPKNPFNYKDNPNAIFNSFQNWAWNKFFRAEFVKDNELRFQEVMRTNDLVFTGTALVCAERIALLPKYLYHYRFGMNTNCQATNSEYPLDFYKAFLQLKKTLEDKHIFDEVKKSYLDCFIDGAVYNINTNKDIDAAVYVYEVMKFEGLKETGVDCYSSLHQDLAKRDLYEELKNSTVVTYMPAINNLIKEKNNQILDLERRIYDLNLNFDILEKRNYELLQKLDILEKIISEKNLELFHLKKSVSFRVGRFLTFPLRKIRDILKKFL